MRINKIFYLPILLFLFSSCSNHSEYPEPSIITNGILHIGYCPEKELRQESQLPDLIQSKIEQYLIRKLGNSYYEQLEFNLASEFNNSDSECYLDLNYPVYSLRYKLDYKEFGLDDFPVYFCIDRDGKIFDHTIFPRFDADQKHQLFSLDSVYNVLDKMSISRKNLELSFFYRESDKEFYWCAKTYLRGGIAGPTCEAKYKYHFLINAITGEYMELN